jgi:hypothetical protein
MVLNSLKYIILNVIFHAVVAENLEIISLCELVVRFEINPLRLCSIGVYIKALQMYFLMFWLVLFCVADYSVMSLALHDLHCYVLFMIFLHFDKLM